MDRESLGQAQVNPLHINRNFLGVLLTKRDVLYDDTKGTARPQALDIERTDLKAHALRPGADLQPVRQPGLERAALPAEQKGEREQPDSRTGQERVKQETDGVSRDPVADSLDAHCTALNSRKHINDSLVEVAIRFSLLVPAGLPSSIPRSLIRGWQHRGKVSLAR